VYSQTDGGHLGGKLWSYASNSCLEAICHLYFIKRTTLREFLYPHDLVKL